MTVALLRGCFGDGLGQMDFGVVQRLGSSDGIASLSDKPP